MKIIIIMRKYSFSILFFFFFQIVTIFLFLVNLRVLGAGISSEKDSISIT